MDDTIKRIIEAYKSQYVRPLNKDMYPDGSKPYYQEQEQSYTDLRHLDSPHGDSTQTERYKLVYPDEATNPDWADGNFLSPYDNKLLNITKTPNTNKLLFDHLKGGAMIDDLGNKSANAVDCFLSPSKNIIKISSSMDLTEFMKVSEDILIHKSKQDLWKMFKDKEGNVFIKRLFDDSLITE